MIILKEKFSLQSKPKVEMFDLCRLCYSGVIYAVMILVDFFFFWFEWTTDFACGNSVSVLQTMRTSLTSAHTNPTAPLSFWYYSQWVSTCHLSYGQKDRICVPSGAIKTVAAEVFMVNLIMALLRKILSQLINTAWKYNTTCFTQCWALVMCAMGTYIDLELCKKFQSMVLFFRFLLL